MATLVCYSVGVATSDCPCPDQNFDDLKEAKAYARKMAFSYGRDKISIVGYFEYDF